MYKTLQQIVPSIVANRLVDCGLNQSLAAQSLGISRATIRAYLIEYVGTDIIGRRLNEAVLKRVLKERQGNDAHYYDEEDFNTEYLNVLKKPI